MDFTAQSIGKDSGDLDSSAFVDAMKIFGIMPEVGKLCASF